MLKPSPEPPNEACPAVERRSDRLPIFLSISRREKMYSSNFHFASRS